VSVSPINPTFMAPSPLTIQQTLDADSIAADPRRVAPTRALDCGQEPYLSFLKLGQQKLKTRYRLGLDRQIILGHYVVNIIGRHCTAQLLSHLFPQTGVWFAWTDS
jgi:hypothetical protein